MRPISPIRKALGASRIAIVLMLLWRFTKPVLWANLIAWPVGRYAMRRWLERFACRTDIDLWILVGSGICRFPAMSLDFRVK